MPGFGVHTRKSNAASPAVLALAFAALPMHPATAQDAYRERALRILQAVP
jgi:hypothetical protein